MGVGCVLRKVSAYMSLCCVYVCTHVYVHEYVCVPLCQHVCAYVCLCISVCMYIYLCLFISVCVGLLPCVARYSDFLSVESSNRLCSPNSNWDLASHCRAMYLSLYRQLPCFWVGTVTCMSLDCLHFSPGLSRDSACRSWGRGGDSVSQAGPFSGQPA